MAVEDKYADEKLTDDELDRVVGGTWEETSADGYELFRRGILDREDFSNLEVEYCLHKMGYTGYVSWVGSFMTFGENGEFIGNCERSNVYTDKSGKIISRETFWANFDAENGTSIIR